MNANNPLYIRIAGLFLGILVGVFPATIFYFFTLSSISFWTIFVLFVGFYVLFADKIAIVKNQYLITFSILFSIFVFPLHCYMGLFFLVFLESGMDDGPYSGTAYTGNITSQAISQKEPYKSGSLLVLNRSEDQRPILAYRNDDGETVWAYVLEVEPGTHLSEIQIQRIRYGVLRDCLQISAKWTYGHEGGSIYLWKWGGIHRFWLSW